MLYLNHHHYHNYNNNRAKRILDKSNNKNLKCMRSQDSILKQNN